MSGPDSPYRRIAPKPTTPARRRAVATRPETPEEQERREALELADSRRQAFRAQSAAHLEELHRAQRAFAIGMRLSGAALLGLALFTISMDASAIADGATSLRVSRLGPFGLVLGPYLMIFGGGGAASRESLPIWWQIGAGIGLAVGVLVGNAYQVDLALWIADTFL